jgi:hypothetical protein
MNEGRMRKREKDENKKVVEKEDERWSEETE